jgi:hypothetical protein
MTFRKALTLAALGLTVAGTAAFSQCQEMIYLSAHQDVSAYAADNWSYQDPADAVVSAGASVPVTGCVSDKNDIHVVVVVSGHTFFVGPGEYMLLRRRASLSEAWLNPRAIYSCYGLLPGISAGA